MGKPWENGGFMGFNGIYPLVICEHCYVKLPIEIVDIPYPLEIWWFSIAMQTKNYQRVTPKSGWDSVTAWLYTYHLPLCKIWYTQLGVLFQIFGKKQDVPTFFWKTIFLTQFQFGFHVKYTRTSRDTNGGYTVKFWIWQLGFSLTC